MSDVQPPFPETDYAYPLTVKYEAGTWTWPGMTLRDWFAGQALAGELAGWRSSTEGHEFNIARRAYAAADAMLEARK